MAFKNAQNTIFGQSAKAHARSITQLDLDKSSSVFRETLDKWNARPANVVLPSDQEAGWTAPTAQGEFGSLADFRANQQAAQAGEEARAAREAELARIARERALEQEMRRREEDEERRRREQEAKLKPEAAPPASLAGLETQSTPPPDGMPEVPGTSFEPSGQTPQEGQEEQNSPIQGAAYNPNILVDASTGVVLEPETPPVAEGRFDNTDETPRPEAPREPTSTSEEMPSDRVNVTPPGTVTTPTAETIPASQTTGTPEGKVPIGTGTSASTDPTTQEEHSVLNAVYGGVFPSLDRLKEMGEASESSQATTENHALRYANRMEGEAFAYFNEDLTETFKTQASDFLVHMGYTVTEENLKNLSRLLFLMGNFDIAKNADRPAYNAQAKFDDIGTTAQAMGTQLLFQMVENLENQQNPFKIGENFGVLPAPITRDLAEWLSKSTRYELDEAGLYETSHYHWDTNYSAVLKSKTNKQKSVFTAFGNIADVLEGATPRSSVGTQRSIDPYDTASLLRRVTMAGEAMKDAAEGQVYSESIDSIILRVQRAMQDQEDSRARIEGRVAHDMEPMTFEEITYNPKEYVKRVVTKNLTHPTVIERINSVAAIMGILTVSQAIPNAVGSALQTANNLVAIRANYVTWGKALNRSFELPPQGMATLAHQKFGKEFQTALSLANVSMEALISAAARNVDMKQELYNKQELGSQQDALPNIKDLQDALARGEDAGELLKAYKQKGGTARAFQAAYNQALRLMTGDTLVSDKLDTIAFIQQYCLEMQLGPNPISPSEIYRMLEEMDGDRFLRDVLLTEQGLRALTQASKNSLQQITPATHLAGKLVRQHPKMRAGLGMLVTWYPRHAVSWLEAILPFTNTGHYLMRLVRNERQGTDQTGPVQVADILAGTNRNLSDAEHLGLWQALTLDTVQMGGYAMMTLLISGVIGALGFEEPDDPANIYDPFSYKVGGREVRLNWPWTDVLAGPMLMAASIHHGMKYKNMGETWKVFTNGLTRLALDHPLGEIVDLIGITENFNRSLVHAQARESGVLGSNDEIPMGEFLATQMQLFAARQVTRVVTPRIWRDIRTHFWSPTPDNYRRSAGLIYARNPDLESDTPANEQFETVGYQEYAWRSLAQRDDLLALFLNVSHGMLDPFDTVDGEQKTGYLREQQPLMTSSDIANKGWYDYLSVMYYVDDNGTEIELEPGDPIPDQVKIEYRDTSGWTEEQKNERISVVLDLVENLTFEQMDSVFLTIPYKTRDLTVDFLYDRIGERKRAKAEQLYAPGGYYDNSAYPNYNQRKELANELEVAVSVANTADYALIEKLSSDQIRIRSRKLAERETNWGTRYVDDEGNPVTTWEHFLNPDGSELELYPLNDPKSNFQNLRSVRKQDQDTYDFQTPVEQNGPVDMELLTKHLGGMKISGGKLKGEDLMDTLTAGGQLAGTGEQAEITGAMGNTRTVDDNLVTGLRNQVPLAEEPYKYYEKSEELKKREEESEKLIADLKKDSKSGSGSGYRRYGGGGGGGGYTPNIYSNPVRVSFDRANTMFNTKMNYTRLDYLRPSFMTKGSREAYRREDI